MYEIHEGRKKGRVGGAGAGVEVGAPSPGIGVRTVGIISWKVGQLSSEN